jgi:hypothetical protein
LCSSLGAAKFFNVEPNSNTLVVYDARNRVWDDRDTGVFGEIDRDKILTIEEIRILVEGACGGWIAGGSEKTTAIRGWERCG